MAGLLDDEELLRSELKATPRNKLLGLLSDVIAKSYSPQRTQQMQGTAKFLSAPAISQTLDRLSYGEPLTTGAGGLGGTTRIRPEALEAGVTVAPLAGPALRAGTRASKAVGRMAGEELNAAMFGERPGTILGALTPQPKFIYLPNTPSNRNPLVGTRYETQQLPGIVARRPVNYDEMLGGSIMTYPTDMLSRNTLVTNVSDIPLGNNAFVTPGGLMYMMDENNIKNFIGYASNQAAAKSQNTRALQAIEENKKMGGTGRIFMAPHTMPPSGENFSTGPTLGLLSMIKATNPSPSLLDTISDQMRAATVKGKKGKYKDFVGLNDPMAAAQLLTGQGLKAGSAGDLRKVFVDKMSNVAAERGLDFNYPDLQRAMFDPNVMNKPSFWMGDAIYEALPNRGISPGTHGAYGYDIPGIFFGNTRGAPVKEFMQPVYDKILPTQMNKPGSGIGKATVEDMFLAYQHQDEPFNLSGVYADPNQLTRGKLSTAGENISMFMDEEQIKRLKKLLGEE